jgi:hypothetical protein
MSFMNTAFRKSQGQSPEMAPEKKRRGVTVTTEHGRALTFGVSRDRTERMLETMAQNKHHELMPAMQAHKAARLQTKPATPLKRPE